MDTEKKDITTTLDTFLGDVETKTEKIVKSDKSLIERINKKIIIEDDRQLLI